MRKFRFILSYLLLCVGQGVFYIARLVCLAAIHIRPETQSEALHE